MVTISALPSFSTKLLMFGNLLPQKLCFRWKQSIRVLARKHTLLEGPRKGSINSIKLRKSGLQNRAWIFVSSVVKKTLLSDLPTVTLQIPPPSDLFWILNVVNHCMFTFSAFLILRFLFFFIDVVFRSFPLEEVTFFWDKNFKNAHSPNKMQPMRNTKKTTMMKPQNIYAFVFYFASLASSNRKIFCLIFCTEHFPLKLTWRVRNETDGMLALFIFLLARVSHICFHSYVDLGIAGVFKKMVSDVFFCCGTVGFFYKHVILQHSKKFKKS